MPNSRKRRTRPRRKVRGQRRKKARINRSFPSFNSGLVKSHRKVSVKYFECFNVNPGVGGATSYYSFRANSIFDPNKTGGGHQPWGHDTLEALYTKYVVVSSTIKVKFMWANATLTEGNRVLQPTTVGIFLDNNATTGTISENNIHELPRTVKAVIPPGPGAVVNLRKNYSYKLMSKALYDDQGIAAFGANPTFIPTFHVMASNSCTGYDTNSLQCYGEVKYNVICYEPKQLSES